MTSNDAFRENLTFANELTDSNSIKIVMEFVLKIAWRLKVLVLYFVGITTILNGAIPFLWNYCSHNLKRFAEHGQFYLKQDYNLVPRFFRLFLSGETGKKQKRCFVLSVLFLVSKSTGPMGTRLPYKISK